MPAFSKICIVTIVNYFFEVAVISFGVVPLYCSTTLEIFEKNILDVHCFVKICGNLHNSYSRYLTFPRFREPCGQRGVRRPLRPHQERSLQGDVITVHVCKVPVFVWAVNGSRDPNRPLNMGGSGSGSNRIKFTSEFV